MLFRLVLFVLIITMSFSARAYSGILSDFENSSVERKSGKSKSVKKKHSSKSSDNDSCLSTLIGDLLIESFGIIAFGSLILIKKGGGDSMKRAGVETDSATTEEKEKIILRKKGEALLSNLRFDYGYKNNSGVYSSDYRLEGGFGAVGVQIRKTEFVEKSPDDKLDISYVHGLYRMSLGNYAELDAGVGKIKIDGNEKNSGTSFTLPLIVHPTENFGIEFRPTWSRVNGNSIRDVDISALFGVNHISLKAGYRRLSAGENSIEGPYIGLSVRY